MNKGFIYIWRDKLKNLYYIGSHIGSIDDGYICSSIIMKSAYKKRPHNFKRRILEVYENPSREFIIQRENAWLSLIKVEELNKKRYYNLKNVAAGGNIYSCLTEQQKEEFKKKCSIASKNYFLTLSQEQKELNRLNAFGGNTFSREYMTSRNRELCSKTAEVKYPCGKTELVTNLSDFAKANNLNYGNLKTVLRGNSNRKSIKGFTGRYL